MANQLEESGMVPWWSLVLRGGLAAAFGLLALIAPVVSLTALLFWFGAYALVDGAFSFAAALLQGSRAGSAGILLRGIVGIVAGIGTLFFPLVTAWALTLLVGAWAVVTGLLEILVAVRLRKLVRGEWLLGVSGAVSILLGLTLAVMPIRGALALMMWFGIWALCAGAVLVVLGLRNRERARPPRPMPQRPLTAARHPG